MYFGNYDASNRRELIAFFRQALPERIQENWPRFDTSLHPDAASIRRSKRLLYLLVAIAIVALLLALLLPVIR